MGHRRRGPAKHNPRPELYRTRLCRNDPFGLLPSPCPFGNKCQFAHGLTQLLVRPQSPGGPPPLRAKTAPPPSYERLLDQMRINAPSSTPSAEELLCCLTALLDDGRAPAATCAVP